MNFISPNYPAYYLTAVAKDRLPIFRPRPHKINRVLSTE
jgi:hypothetical protein